MHGKPTELELKILSRLWDLGESGTVREVLQGWPGKDTPGYTTVLKILQIMEAKGYVTHARTGRAYRYSTRLRREEHSRGRFREMLQTLFRGNRLELVSALVEEVDLTDEEIRKIRRLLTDKAKERRA